MLTLMKCFGYYCLSAYQYDFLISFCQVMREFFMWMTILLFFIWFFNIDYEELFNLFALVGVNFFIFYSICDGSFHPNSQIFKVDLWYLIFVLVSDLLCCFKGLFYIVKQFRIWKRRNNENKNNTVCADKSKPCDRSGISGYKNK